MARADWRSAGAYEELQPLDAPAFAYEFLCRNPDFLSDHASLVRKSRSRTLDSAEAEEFARRWGVRFRPQFTSLASQCGSLDAAGPPDGSGFDQMSGRPRRF